MYFNYYNSCGLDGGADCSIEVESTPEQDYIYYKATILGDDPNDEPELQDLISQAYKEAMEFEISEYGSDNDDYVDERRSREKDRLLELAYERNPAVFKAAGIPNIGSLEDDIRERENYDLLEIFGLEEYAKPDKDDDDYEPEDDETARKNDAAIEEFLDAFNFYEWVEEAYDDDFFYAVDIYEIDPDFEVDYSSCFDGLGVSMEANPDYELDELMDFMELAVGKNDLEFIKGIIDYVYDQQYDADEVVNVLNVAIDKADAELRKSIIACISEDFNRRKSDEEDFESKNEAYMEFYRTICGK